MVKLRRKSQAHKQWTYSGLMSSLYSYLSSPASTQASVEAREFSGEGGGGGFLLLVFVFYIEFALLPHLFVMPSPAPSKYRL